MPREMKMDVLDNIAQTIFSYKAYPKSQEIESVAEALIEKHVSETCLKDPGIGTGYHGWAMSIKYKLGNYRQKLRMAGCSEVTINQRKDEEKKKGIKKAKKCEVNFLPDNPAGETAESLERVRQALEEETQKKLPNKAFVNSKMELTFAVRRKEIVDEEPLVTDIMKRWPGLFVQEQVSFWNFWYFCVKLNNRILTFFVYCNTHKSAGNVSPNTYSMFMNTIVFLFLFVLFVCLFCFRYVQSSTESPGWS